MIERIGDATLYLGDCREVMPTIEGPVVILTDPVWPNCPKGAIQGSDDPFGLWQEAMSVAPAHDRLVAVMRSDSDPRMLAAGTERLEFFRTILLPYALPGYIGRTLGGDEIAYWFGTPVLFQPGRQMIPGRGPLVQPGGRPPNGHPMSRAQPHFDWLARWCTDDGETALDPFMGSGTTGVACAKLGRRFIGIEIEPRYFEIACRRIEEAQRQGDMFVPRQAAATQEALL